ncbi:MAG TPA: orotidine-5'-phosphate decarboxylase [bacterium]|nr:orotidine-5'-phosphate decarboxylase [bacterium]HPQ67079.1 orotidine-5'-phosphate decarboxylase [bacterium]
MKWERKTGIVLALDVPDRERAFSLLDEVADFIDVIKFNYPLILREGLRIVTDIKRRYRKPILADFKVADVPVTNDRIVRLAAEAGADGIMVHGFIGIDALRSARRAAGTMKVLVVTQLTNPGGLDFTAQFTEEFAGLAKLLELDGVQAPGNRPEVVARVREIVGPELTVVCCGIGAQGGRFGAAIAAGADFEIVGRAIYDAPEPPRAVEKIRAAIAPGLGKGGSPR